VPESNRHADEFEDLRAGEERALPRLFGEYGRGERARFTVGAGASLVSMAMELVPAYVLAVAIDSLFFDTRPFALPLVPADWLPPAQAGQFLLVATLLGGAHVVGAVFGWLNSWAWNGFAQHFQHAVRVDAYDALQRRELGFFDDRQTGEVMSILNNDVNQLENFLTNSLNTGIRIVVRVGGMGAVMLLVNWRLALLPVVVIPVLAYASYRFVEAIQPKYRTVRSAVGRLNSRLENNVGGIGVLKAFTTEEFERDRVADASREYLDAQWDAITTRIAFWPTIRLITAAGYVATFVIGGWWVIFGSPHPFFRGTLTAGTLVLFLSYSRRFMWPMRQFGQVINNYQYAEAAGQRIVGLLDSTPRVTDRPGAEPLGDVDGHVEYDHVTFDYGGGASDGPGAGAEASTPDERAVNGPASADGSAAANGGSVAERSTDPGTGDDESPADDPGDTSAVGELPDRRSENEADTEYSGPVIDDVSFVAEPGSFVGVVGPTGAGKTTLLKLLLRLYDVDAGAVRIDGTDVREVTLASLRRAIGYVSQEPYLFHGTVRENVAYGLPDATDEEIVAAATRAGAHDFVSAFDDGYDTLVGERGVKLSGGQRQRLSIARTILRDPPIVVLDEATSHVDNETEAFIQRSLRELTADRTTFAIAHRLSTVRDADEILVMEDGRLIDRGTHDELVAGDGLYADLWRVQIGAVDAGDVAGDLATGRTD
jgi:ATP-binding cassette subfamily B protein